MMRWLRKHLLPKEDVDVDRAVFQQREEARDWRAAYIRSIEVTERVIRGERRHRNTGHTPERRHG
jgi:hypothetical protein